MANTSLKNLGGSLTKATAKLSEQQLEAAEKAVRATYIATSNEIIMKTPVDKGRARANWFLTKGSQKRKSAKGRNYQARLSEVQRKLSGDVLGKVFYLANNLPYIATLEYGGYPKNPKKGSRVKKGKGDYEIRSANGFSKQAPNGMVRLSAAKFKKRFRRYLGVYNK